MRALPKNVGSPGWLSTVLVLGAVALGVGTLYWAREVLIPTALAILIALILAPIVTLLRRGGFGHTLSVIMTVVLAFLLIGGMGTLVVTELGSLANNLPTYRHNIHKKIADLKGALKSGPVKRIQTTVEEVMNEVDKENPPANAGGAVPVVVKEGGRFNVSLVTLLFRPAATAALVAVLVIFMLLRWDNLRDRLLRVAGYGRLAVTTKAINEAGRQVSRFLFCQFLVNTGYGISVGLGLWLIGLPYALLWGFLAGMARFIPYAGPVIGVTPPVLMSLAVFSHWTAPLMVIGLFLVLEPVTAFLLEPVAYGKRIGVSEVALLIMMAFWTWLWGPVGLVLSAPMTVCLMVVSKSVPRLGFISLMLSREPAMETHQVLYHRLIARDEAEAKDILDKFLAEHPRSTLFDQVLIPVLISCRRDYQRHLLTEDDRRFVLHFIRCTIESSVKAVTVNESGRGRARVVACPATDEADELALLMLAELLHSEQQEMRVLSFEKFSAEAILETEQARPAVLCIGFLPEAPFTHARHLCKRLRQRFPDLPILLAHWQATEHDSTQQQFGELVSEFGWSMAETKNQLIQYAQMETPSRSGGKEPSPDPDAWMDHERVLVPEETET